MIETGTTFSTDPLDPRRTQLRRMKIGAIVLLLTMIGGFVTSHAMGGQGVWAWVRAFCEAATVGALADWFAVVALFRRPMGLPIPHTAIIPANKERIGDNLAAFVSRHFLDPDTLLDKLRSLDPASRIGVWLGEPQQVTALSQGTRKVALQMLDLLDEQAVRQVILNFVTRGLRRWDAAAGAGEVLGLLTRDGRHRQLLDAALERMSTYLGQPEIRERASGLLVKYARREWPRIIGTVDRISSVGGMADRLAERLAQVLIQELQEILATPEHPVRQNYEGWVADYIERLRTDPDVAEQVRGIQERLINEPRVQDYVRGLWGEIHAALRRDLSAEDSAMARHLEAALRGMGTRLGSDPALKEAVNSHILSAAAKLVQGLRASASSHISRTVRNWDEKHLVDELELSVGRDLQYIRFNGTLVGGLIGLILHAAVLVFTT